MRIFKLAAGTWRDRGEKILARVIKPTNRKDDLHELRQSKAGLAWRRKNQTVEIRARSTTAYAKQDAFELIFSRTEILILASAFLRDMGDESFLAAVKKAGEIDVSL